MAVVITSMDKIPEDCGECPLSYPIGLVDSEGRCLCFCSLLPDKEEPIPEISRSTECPLKEIGN